MPSTTSSRACPECRGLMPATATAHRETCSVTCRSRRWRRLQAERRALVADYLAAVDFVLSSAPTAAALAELQRRGARLAR